MNQATATVLAPVELLTILAIIVLGICISSAQSVNRPFLESRIVHSWIHLSQQILLKFDGLQRLGIETERSAVFLEFVHRWSLALFFIVIRWRHIALVKHGTLGEERVQLLLGHKHHGIVVIAVKDETNGPAGPVMLLHCAHDGHKEGIAESAQVTIGQKTTIVTHEGQLHVINE